MLKASSLNYYERRGHLSYFIERGLRSTRTPIRRNNNRKEENKKKRNDGRFLARTWRYPTDGSDKRLAYTEEKEEDD